MTNRKAPSPCHLVTPSPCHLFLAAVLLLTLACQTLTSAATPTVTLSPIPNLPSPTPVGQVSNATPIPNPTVAPAGPQPPTLSPQSPIANLPSPTLFGTAWDDRSLFRSGLIPAEQSILDGLPGATVYHISLDISDDLVNLTGREELRYTNNEGVSLREVYFRLFPNLAGGSSEVANLQINGRPVEPATELENSAMRVPLDPPLNPGEQVVVTMEFNVTVPSADGGNYGTFAYLDNVLALAHAYPMIAVYDDEGWNVEIAPSQGDVVYADSSFYLVRVTAPADLVIAASGVTVEQATDAGRQTLTFAAGPMRDFYLVASSDYERVSETVGDTTLNSYANAAEDATRALEIAVNAVESFNARFGSYPFTELDVAATPTLAGGVEYPGIVVIAGRLYDDSGTGTFFESATAHEVGHQWFYSVVGNDQIDEPWLDEALTQYATGLYYEDVYGESGRAGFFGAMEDRWQRSDRADIPIGLPVASYEGQEYGSIVYGRGPIFFDVLSQTMGDEAFKDFLHDYFQTFKWGIATTEGLKQVAEENCACNLTALFLDWVYPP